MKKKILEIKQMTFTYDDEENALNDISVTIHEKERIAILGTNGAGKSTFFLCCNGVLHPNSGEIYLYERKIGHSKKDMIELRKTVGIVFQDPNQQFIGTTVYDDISFGAMNIGLDKKTSSEKIEKAIKTMNLNKLTDRPPHYLSGGEKKRLSIADVLVMEPDIILFDEPTAFLDGYNTEILKENLDILHNEGKSLVISTHDIDFAFEWADRIIIFDGGKIIADGDTLKLLTDTDLINRANLKPPFLYSIIKSLEGKGIIFSNENYPRNIMQFEKILYEK